MNGNPRFQMRQGLPLQHHTMVYSMQRNPQLPPTTATQKERAWAGNHRANITTVSGGASSCVGTEGLGHNDKESSLQA